MFQVLQRKYVICETDSKTNAADIAEAMRDAYPGIEFTYRKVGQP